MAKIDRHITLNRNCIEGMTLYNEHPGNELTIQTIADSPWVTSCQHAYSNVPAGKFNHGPQRLLRSDMKGEVLKENAITLSLTCNSDDELRTHFQSLQVAKLYDDYYTFFGGTIAL